MNNILLHIESTSTACSVALSLNEDIIALQENDNGFTHAENLHIFIEQILKEANISISQLQAISISSGPGSYTGLRIGYSTAKGLCYALSIPLIEVSTLKALTHSIISNDNKDAYFCPMMDARRMEVYTSCYDGKLNELKPLSALVIDEQNLAEYNLNKPIYFFGNGMPKAQELIYKQVRNCLFINDVKPSAKSLVLLAYKQFLNQNFVNIAYAEPLYLKEFFFTTAKK
jgi:tRNA threonylcarbamoyladenosine biosynthesis protein TsaB